MSDGMDVVIAWGAGHSWVRSSIQRAHQVAVVQIGTDQACVKGHVDVGHEAVGTVEDTPCWRMEFEQLRREGLEKVPSHRRRARVVPGFGGWDDRHERLARVTIYQSESPIKGTEMGGARRRGGFGGAIATKRRPR